MPTTPAPTPAQRARFAWENRFSVLPYYTDPEQDLSLIGKDRAQAIATYAKWPNVTPAMVEEFAAAYPQPINPIGEAIRRQYVEDCKRPD